jgi:hypothetical protein
LSISVENLLELSPKPLAPQLLFLLNDGLASISRISRSIGTLGIGNPCGRNASVVNNSSATRFPLLFRAKPWGIALHCAPAHPLKAEESTKRTVLHTHPNTS